MITSVRNYIQKKNSQKIVLILLIGASLVFSSISLIRKASSNIKAIAFVENYPISQREFQSAVANLKEVFKAYGYNKISMPDIKKIALNQVAQEKIMDITVDRLGVNISQEFIVDKLQDPSFIINYLNSMGISSQVFDPRGGINHEALKKYLKAIGMTANEFDVALEHAVKQIILGQILGSALYISNQDIKDGYIKQYSPRKFTVYSVSLASYLDAERKKSVSDEQLKKFFDKESVTTGRYIVSEKRDIKKWVFNLKDFDSKNNKNNKIIFKKEVADAFAQNKFEQLAQSKKAKQELLINQELNNSKLSQKIFKMAVGGRDIYIEQDKGIVLQVIKLDKSYTPEFASIKNKIKEDFYAENAKIKLLEDLKKSEVDSAFLRSLQPKQETISNFNLDNKELVNKLISKQLPVGRMAQMTRSGQFIYDLAQDQGFLVRLDSADINQDILKEKTADIRKKLEVEALRQAQYWLVASLGRSAKIEMNNTTGQTELIEFE